jgi:hypothetical protein
VAQMLGRGLAKLVLGLLKSVLALVFGLLKGLASPVTNLIVRRRRAARRKRDLGAVKKDWSALLKGKTGKQGRGIAKRTRRRLEKRGRRFKKRLP